MIFVLVAVARNTRSVAGNKAMKILIFLHGTAIMHQNAVGKTREERVGQSIGREESVLDYGSYVPIGNVVGKLKKWKQQGAKILYVSSHKSEIDINKDILVLKKYEFPEGEVLFRKNGESYQDVVGKVVPDVLIEDDCESIGGEGEMIITHVEPEIKKKLKSIVVREFQGIDNLPDNISLL